MTTTLDAILDAAQQQLTLDDLLATLEAEERDGHCEVEAICYDLLGVNPWRIVKGQKVRVYICGFQTVGTVESCPKRKRLLYGGES